MGYLEAHANSGGASMTLDIHTLLAPRSIAVIGSTSREGGLGSRLLANLASAGFAGEVAAHDPTQEPSADVDIAAIAVPAEHVQSVLDRWEGRAQHAIVMSSGFEEAGSTALRAPRDTTLIGPNSVGLYAQDSRMVLTFAQAFADMTDCPPGGGAFLISQSGAFGARVARAARARGFALDGFIGTGNETALSATTFGRALVESEQHRPRVLMLYIEAVRDADDVVSMLNACREHDVAVVALVGGRSQVGANAAASHTSALATDSDVLIELLKMCGAHVVHSDRELLTAAHAIAVARRVPGHRVALVTGSGGAGVVAADILASHGLAVPTLSAELQASLLAHLPAFASAANPVDVTAQAVADAELVGRLCAEIAASGEVDAVVAIGRTAFVAPLQQLKVPAVVALLDGLGAPEMSGDVFVAGDLEAMGEAVAALTGAVRRDAPVELIRHDAELAEVTLSASDSLALFEEAGIEVAPWAVVQSPDEAEKHAGALGWPVVLKSDVDAATHKALAGGVRLGVSREALRSSVAVMLAGSEQVIVATQIAASLELFVGVRHDPTFGLVVTAGLGGSNVELMGRTVTMPAAVSAAELTAALNENVFARGGQRYDTLAAQLADVAQRMIRVAQRGYGLVEANPIGVADGSLIALDARVVVHDV
ncbi:acetate--CoA ligase family protein [Microbacterium sp. NC79]|uniref:acetate--CoA ligase family protein n=1 Tax=Microbacterium sp. NC79 TaxID=2851009 RepID=UPI001C2C9363|nr:acetate--CoA ligase family protein [Microbacterium sp. NC79]MBV0896133.1 acetate--CoA ligase family protein [Microbacterium sp. NC79]